MANKSYKHFKDDFSWETKHNNIRRILTMKKFVIMLAALMLLMCGCDINENLPAYETGETNERGNYSGSLLLSLLLFWEPSFLP